jgi:hypothetical protein
MTARYSVMVGFRSYEMQEMAQTFWYDANKSRLQKAARNQATQTTLEFSFPYHASGVPPIKEGMQVWIGWRDGGTWLQGPDPPWIGYLMEPEGGGNGEEHTITVQASSCQILFTRTDVIGWPVGADTGMGVEGQGYPGGYSVTNWLVGTDPYPGIIRARLQNIDFSGVDPAFDSYILDDAHIPGGNAGKYTVGQWGGGLTLDEVLQDICATVRLLAQEAGQLVTPVYFFDTVAQGSLLRPRFRFIDANDASGPIKAVLSVQPSAGQYRIRAFKHRRVFTESRTRVVTWGLGTHLAADGTEVADFAIYDGHADDYPTEYQVDPGWSGRAYTDEHFTNQADCDRAAATLGYRLWGALGEITCQVDGVAVGTTVITYFAQGDVIAIDNPAEGLAAADPRVLRNVELVPGTAGHPVWTLTLGDVVPDAADLIRGATVVQPQQRLNAGGAGHTGAPGAALGPRGLPDVPGRIGIDRQPTNAHQNQVQPIYRDVPGQTYKATTQDRPGADPALVTPANLTEWHDANKNVMDYHTPLGVSPARMPFDFSTVGTVKWTSDETGQFLRAVVTPSTCAFTLTVAGVTVANPPIYAQTGSSGDPLTLISAGDVVPYAEGDEIAITATVAGTVTLSHRATQVVPT